jgi:hypothetical protein
LALLLATAAAGRADGPGGDLAAWQRARESALTEPGLLRYYGFDDLTSAGRVANLAPGGDSPLTWGGDEPLAIVAGRWPGKKAAHLDKGFLQAAPFAVGPEGFTVEAWVRKTGFGALRGNGGATDGALLSVGNGYWDGWRVTTTYPTLQSGFEIGRPQPGSSFGIGGEALADGAWHHLAASWDGHVMRLWHDGLPAGRGAYDGAYTAPKSGGLRIGFADSGWGSTLLDVDELRVYGRARSAAEIFRAAHFWLNLPDPVRGSLETVLANLDDPAKAAALGSVLLEHPNLPPDLAAAVRLQRASACLAGGDARAAGVDLAAVANDPAVAEGHRAQAATGLVTLLPVVGDGLPTAVLNQLLAAGLNREQELTARLCLARRLLAEKRLTEAQEQFAKVAAMPDLTPQRRLDLQLQRAHLLRGSGQAAQAAAAYAKLAAAPEASADFRALAQLEVGATWVAAKQWDRAAVAFGAIAPMTDCAEHLRAEAVERAAEAERLRAGLPARDPLASRTPLPALPKSKIQLFVAPGGRDDAPGTHDQPLATLAGARDKIRALARPLPAGGVTVWLRGGLYPVRQTTTFEAADSGTAEAPIVYRAWPGEKAVLSGGATLKDLARVTEAAILERLPAESRGHVLVCDLKANGVTDFGRLTPRGMPYGAEPLPEFFWNGQALSPARWPKEGFLEYKELVTKGDGKGGFTIRYEGDRPSRWLTAKDPWLFGYWNWRWADERLPLAAINPADHTLTSGAPARYDIRAGQTYYVYNLLEELSQPGECYLDRESGKLYLWPPSDPAQATLAFSLLNGPFIAATDLSQVRFHDLTFELGRLDGVKLTGGESCLLTACTIAELAGTAVLFDGGHGHGAVGCDLHTLGRGGTWVRGGDRKTLTPGGHFIENCHIWDFSRIDRTYTPAFWTDGVANRFVHNLVHDSPAHAMRIEGNDHLIAYNEIHSVVYESDDQGGADMWFNPAYRGNRFLYNWWHHIGNGLDLCGQAGIRLDDAISGVLIYGNVFQKCSAAGFGGVQVHGGKDNWIDNNLFVDCKQAISFSGWGAERWAKFLKQSDVQNAIAKVVDITQPPYSTRYPDLARLAEDEGVNRVWRNVVYRCGAFMVRDRDRQLTVDNLVTAQDPGLVAADKSDFRWRRDAAALAQCGARPIPFEEIGLYQDANRANWPVRSQVSHYKLP